MYQFLIMVCGSAAIWLLTLPNGVLIARHPFVPRRWRNTPLPARRLACYIGLVGQVAWFHETILAQQWGALVLTTWYTWCYVRGVLNPEVCDGKVLQRYEEGSETGPQAQEGQG